MKVTRRQLKQLIQESLMHKLALEAIPEEFNGSTLTSHGIGLIIQGILELYQSLPDHIFRSKLRSGFEKTDAALEIPARLEYFISMNSNKSVSNKGSTSYGKLMTPAGRENLTALNNLTSEVAFVSVFFKIAHDTAFYLSNNQDDLIKMGEKYDDFLVTSNAHGISPVHLFFKTIFLQAGLSKSVNIKSFTPPGFSKSFSFINRPESELKETFNSTLRGILIPLLDIADNSLQNSELSYEQRASGGTTIAEIFEYFRRGFGTKDGMDRFKVFFKMIKTLTPDQVVKEIYANTDGIDKIVDVNVRFFVEMMEGYSDFVEEYKSEFDEQTYQSYDYHASHLINAANNTGIIMKFYNGSYSLFLDR